MGYSTPVGRGAGRTHRMIEWYMDAVARNVPAVIVAPPECREHIVNILKLVSTHPLVISTLGLDRLGGFKGRVFLDHTVFERCSPQEIEDAITMVTLCWR